MTAVLTATALAKAVAAALAGALVRRPRRLPRVLPERLALLAGVLLAGYGGVLVAVGAVALSGALGPVADRPALAWHVLFWDPWFLVWGLLLVVAALAARRLRTAREPSRT